LKTISRYQAPIALSALRPSQKIARDFKTSDFCYQSWVLANTRRSLALLMSADNAIPLGLMNVIVTNSAKHAYPEGSGEIRVSGERRGAELLGFKVIKSCSFNSTDALQLPLQGRKA
jgi:hypothetical protein